MKLKEKVKAIREKMWEDTRKICFSHVPKCAGTSVGAAIDKQYYKFYQRILFPNFGIKLEASGRVAKLTSRPMKDVREELLGYALSLTTYKMAGSHVPCRPKLVEEFRGTWNFITVLRNPVDRWISEYLYNTYKPHSWAKNYLPLDDYVTSKAGVKAGRSYLLYFSNIPDDYQGNLDPYIDEAVDNLNRFAIVGIAEDLETFIAKFENVFGKKLKIAQKNIGPKNNMKNQITENKALMKKIEKLCEADTIIYQRVMGKVHESAA